MKYLLIVALLAGTAWGGEQEVIYYSLLDPDLSKIRMCTMSFHGDNGATADIDWCDGKMRYSGDLPLQESAVLFFNAFPEVCKDMAGGSDLIDAAKGVLPYLRAPSDPAFSLSSAFLVYTPPPTELESAEGEVERLKKKDAAIKRFREALRRVE